MFAYSALLHEVAVGVPFRLLKGWAFLAMFGQVGKGGGEELMIGPVVGGRRWWGRR